MPSKNTVKLYDSNTYYHVYNRGVEKRQIFLDDDDYAVFTHLLKRYLSEEAEFDSYGRPYDNFATEVELVAFCLMPNHFHMLVYQIEPDAITKLLRAVCSAYVRYFNEKYDRVGGLFQGIFKASPILRDSYWLYITRYIHKNPKNFMQWQWSSLGVYLGKVVIPWVHSERVISPAERSWYLSFIRQDVDIDQDNPLQNLLADS